PQLHLLPDRGLPGVGAEPEEIRLGCRSLPARFLLRRVSFERPEGRVSELRSFDPVLLTGAAGFIGACAVRALLERGHNGHGLVRPRSDLWRLRGLERSFVAHRLDLVDALAVETLIGAVRPGAVLHLAAYGAYERRSVFPQMVRSNILGTFHLLEAAAGAGERA